MYTNCFFSQHTIESWVNISFIIYFYYFSLGIRISLLIHIPSSYFSQLIFLFLI